MRQYRLEDPTRWLRAGRGLVPPASLSQLLPEPSLPCENYSNGGSALEQRATGSARVTDTQMPSTSAELARCALDAAPDAMIILDGAGIIRFANRQASTLFGYDREEIIDRNVELLMPERFRGRHVGHWQTYARAPRVRPMG